MAMDVVVWFFVLGVFARVVRSDLRLPEALYETLSIYLLLAIGLKGGIELSKQPLADLAPQVAACLAMGFAIPFMLVPMLRRIGFDKINSAALAAHYGSVSVVTYAVASTYLQKQQVPAESHAALWVALLEAPGLLAGILLARMGQGGGTTRWRELAHDVFLGKSVLLLAGGLLIGAVVGEAGTKPIAPVFIDPFKGVLALFLLELGLVARCATGGGSAPWLAPAGGGRGGSLAAFCRGRIDCQIPGAQHGRGGPDGHTGGQCQLYCCTHCHAHCGS
jgi:hypothetical protein